MSRGLRITALERRLSSQVDLDEYYRLRPAYVATGRLPPDRAMAELLWTFARSFEAVERRVELITQHRGHFPHNCVFDALCAYQVSGEPPQNPGLRAIVLCIDEAERAEALEP